MDKTTSLTEFTDSIRIFRTDQITTKGCGNKQFKLVGNLRQLKRDGATRVLSFGGLWSNHLHAFALACQSQGFDAVAVVRGEKALKSALLENAINHGLTVHFVSRSDYRRRHDEGFIHQLMDQLNCDAWLPEGGSNQLAVDSCRALAGLINEQLPQLPSQIALAVGTGATMAGIIKGASAGQQVIGVPVVQDDRLRSNIEDWTNHDQSINWQLFENAYPPRYGKVDLPLLEFVLETYSNIGVILDPVYNAKALKSLLATSLAGELGGDIVFVHTGGLGGCLGFADDLMAIDSRVAGQLLSEVAQILELDGH